MLVIKKYHFRPGCGPFGRSLFLMLLAWSCTPKYLSEEELKVYVTRDEGLSRSKESNSYRVTSTYRPTDLLIAQELGGEYAADMEELTRLRKKYEPYYYFILSFSKDDKEALYGTGGSYDQFSDMVQTLSFRMGNYVNMTTADKDTIKVADYVFSPTYGMGGATNVMFVFNKKDTRDDTWVQLNVEEFGLGIGKQAFRFRQKDLEGIPRIKFAVRSSK